MAKFRVWNDNKYDYQEHFKGEHIKIPAKGFVEMDEDDAVMFRGTFAPPVMDADGNHTDKGYKMIRLEKITADMAPTVKVEEHVCLACKYKASSAKDLEEHGKAAHSDILVSDEELDREIARKRKAG